MDMGEKEKKREVANTKQIHKECLYSTSVLVGNWFEDRLADQIDKKAVTPGIFGRSGCINSESEFMSQYRPSTQNPDAACLNYNEYKMDGFRNRIQAELTNFKMSDGKQFDNNLTTMTDIMYRIKPKQVANETDLDAMKMRRREDLLNSYGNATKLGLIEGKLCEQKRENAINWSISTYKTIYTLKKSQGQRKIKKKK